MDCFCDFERPEFCHVELLKANKHHDCNECYGGIRPGERYERARGKWGGSISIFRTCPRCLALRELAQDIVPCFCWLYGNVREDALQTLMGYYHEVPGLLFRTLRLEIAIRRREAADKPPRMVY